MTFTAADESITSASNDLLGSCSITLTTLGTAAGDRVAGTFTATTSNGDGSVTHAMTDGSFDVVLDSGL